jgi:heme exporter protein CcmD
MDFAAPHAGFVIAAYALSALLIAGLTLYVVIRDRKLRAEAAKLDKSRRWNGA